MEGRIVSHTLFEELTEFLAFLEDTDERVPKGARRDAERIRLTLLNTPTWPPSTVVARR